MQDLLALINAPPNQPPAGPPPFEGQPSRIATLMVGQSAWVPLDFPPGNYVFVCGVPDPATGKPHALLGMLLPFTVE